MINSTRDWLREKCGGVKSRLMAPAAPSEAARGSIDVSLRPRLMACRASLGPSGRGSPPHQRLWPRSVVSPAAHSNQVRATPRLPTPVGPGRASSPPQGQPGLGLTALWRFSILVKPRKNTLTLARLLLLIPPCSLSPLPHLLTYTHTQEVTTLF